MATQLEMASRKQTSKEMRHVSKTEFMGIAALRESILKGLTVIPANRNHPDLVPIGIGSGLRIKVNANLGTSPLKSCLKSELAKLRAALEAGADTIMDLSLAGDLDRTRKKIIAHSPVPVGTVPLYQALVECRSAGDLSLRSYLHVFEKHARDGVDFATVHAGVTKEAIPLMEKRLMPSVSRGGTFLVEWMRKHGRQSFLYEGFGEVLDIAKEYDVTISLGDGLRPGCIADATDAAQLFELGILANLAARARAKGVQVMIEGPGHIPLDQIERNITLEKRLCKGAPFYVLGPLPTDAAPGYDHLVGAIGGALAGMYGADFLCYLTSKEHIGLPDAADVREGVLFARIAAHIADIARENPAAMARARAMSEARTMLDWDAMARHALDRKKFRKLLAQERKTNRRMSEGCSMCGEFCTEKKKK